MSRTVIEVLCTMWVLQNEVNIWGFKEYKQIDLVL